MYRLGRKEGRGKEGEDEEVRVREGERNRDEKLEGRLLRGYLAMIRTKRRKKIERGGNRTLKTKEIVFL